MNLENYNRIIFGIKTTSLARLFDNAMYKLHWLKNTFECDPTLNYNLYNLFQDYMIIESYNSTHIINFPLFEDIMSLFLDIRSYLISEGAYGDDFSYAIINVLKPYLITYSSKTPIRLGIYNQCFNDDSLDNIQYTFATAGEIIDRILIILNNIVVEYTQFTNYQDTLDKYIEQDEIILNTISCSIDKLHVFNIRLKNITCIDKQRILKKTFDIIPPPLEYSDYDDESHNSIIDTEW